MDNAHNKHGPVFGPVCRVHDCRGAPPGVMKPPWYKKPRDEVSNTVETAEPWHRKDLVTHRPRDSAARSRAPAVWRRAYPGKPALKPVMGEVYPVVTLNIEVLTVEYQRFNPIPLFTFLNYSVNRKRTDMNRNAFFQEIIKTGNKETGIIAKKTAG